MMRDSGFFVFLSPPVTKKYDSKTKAKTVIAEGCLTHDGFFIFRWGHSKSKNGILYKDSIVDVAKPEMNIKVYLHGQRVYLKAGT